ncbi:MAG: hypothetical protein M1822_004546 [Bathelium mastoideum]|nr:MAG: hypothetical protein M1822_004546 [Bathelium mastoideum]
MNDDHAMEFTGIPAKAQNGNHIEELERAYESHVRDGQTLARLGKKPVLKRNFGVLAILAFSCTVLVTWEGVLELFTTGLENGGPAGLFWSYIVTWFGTLSVFITICELASMAPIASGQYYWVSMLAPPSCRKFLSYLTGWMTALAWQTTITSAGFLSGGIIKGLLVLNHPDQTFHQWQATLIGYAVIVVAVFINTVGSSYLPGIESCILMVHILGFFAILIVVAYMGPHSSAKDVFDNWSNGGDWPSQGTSFMVGLIGNAFAFAGADAAVHMAEEIPNAAIVIPRTIVGSMLLNGVMGLGITVVMIFSLGDVDAITNTPTGYPFIGVIYQATNSAAATTVLSSLVVLSVFFCCLGFVATSSRMIDPRSQVPINTVLVTTVIGALILLISFGSTLALNIILSITIFGFYFTYFLSCALLLWRRCQKGVIVTKQALDSEEQTGYVASEGQLIWGPWRVPGVLGICNNLLACAYCVVIAFFSFWPATVKPELADMNWSCVIVVAALIFSAVYYAIWGRFHYRGPIVETNAHGALS